MKYTRDFTKDEMNLLGDLHKVDTILEGALGTLKHARDSSTVESRILDLMSETEVMGVGQIILKYNNKHSGRTIQTSYLRTVLTKMRSSKLIINKGRGLYVRGKG